MTQLFDLTGRVAVITGGNRGIGLAIGEALASAGSAVAIWARNVDLSEQAAEQIRVHGTRVSVHPCDVANEDDVAAAMESTLGVHGRIDSAFVNAGVGQQRIAFHELPLAEWRRVLGINLDGAFLTMRAVSAHMIERGGGGSMVVLSSVSAHFGQPQGESYSASKAALGALTRSTAVELARHGVRVNALLPGWTETDLTETTFANPTFVDRVGKRIPLRRWGKPSELGGIAIYLASDASSYHTGDTLVIDGGFSVF